MGFNSAFKGLNHVNRADTVGIQKMCFSSNHIIQFTTHLLLRPYTL